MQELQEGFIDYLWKKFQNPNTESVLKKSCVAYMASMMSRAKYFSVELVGEVSMAVVRESGGERGMFGEGELVGEFSMASIKESCGIFG